MAVPMGYNRVYARIDGPLTASSYWDAIKHGRSFATSGPMLTMTVDGELMGSTIRRAQQDAEPLHVEARLRAIEPVDAVQLVHDGKVVAETRLEERPSGLDENFNWNVDVNRSGWVAVRALFRAPDGRLRQAHVSPVYIEVDGKPIADRDDAEYMISWIDRLIEAANGSGRFPTAPDQREVLGIYQRARDVYRKVATTAAEVWKDGVFDVD
jgi:hypothetical protein